jgi:hypothetical protein
MPTIEIVGITTGTGLINFMSDDKIYGIIENSISINEPLTNLTLIEKRLLAKNENVTITMMTPI